MHLLMKQLAVTLLLLITTTAGAQPTLKIGVLGAMSGPAKYWGLTNKYCALATAKMYNEQGGIPIGDERYLIEIHSYDTELDKKTAVKGAKKLIHDEGIRYLIGPNIDDTSFAVLPMIEANNVVNISYGFNPKLFQPPRKNTYLGMMHPTVSAPAIYEYLKTEHGIQTVAFLARRDKEAINQRNTGIRAAEQMGLTVVELDAWDISELTYPANLEGVEQLAKSYANLGADLIVLSGTAPLDTPKLIKHLRNQGHEGFISTETAQEPKVLLSAIPDLDQFVSLGSSPSKAIHTDYMKAFIAGYNDVAGTWHDEAGVKVYALEWILRTIAAAGPDAVHNTNLFKTVAENFSTDDPFYQREEPLKLIKKGAFGAKRQLNVPLTIHAFQEGTIKSISF